MVLALLLTLAFAMYNLTLPLIGGIYIVSDLGGNAYLSPYGVSFFCLGTVLGVPLGKEGMTKLDARQLFIVCMGLMALFSSALSLVTHYLSFVLLRLFEGIACGPLFMAIINYLLPYANQQRINSSAHETQPTKQGILTTYFKRKLHQNHFLVILVLTCFSSAPMVGACWGDWISFYFHWSATFWPNIPICLFLMVYVGKGLKEYKKPPTAVIFDKVGYIFYAVAMLFLGTALTTGQEFDWFRSKWITFLFVSGSLSFVLLWLYSRNTEHPIVEFQLFKNAYFSLGILTLLILFSLYFGVVILLSLWLKLYVNYTGYWIALLTAALLLGIWIPVFLDYEQYDPRFPLIVSLLLLMISCFYSTQFNVDINFGRIVFSRGLVGLIIPVFLPALFRLCIHVFPKPQQLASATFFHIVRLLGSGLGAALYIILWQRRQVFYHERLGSRLTEFSEITQQFLQRAARFHLSNKQAYAQLQVYLDRQATALALEDCFYFMGWMVVVLLICWGITFIFQQRFQAAENAVS